MTKITRTEDGLYAVQVDDHTYSFEKWGAEAALDCLWDISSMVSSPLGSLLMQMFGRGGEGYKTDITPDMAGTITRELSANMRDNKVLGLSIFQRLAGRNVLCDGKKYVFDTHFQDRLPHLFKVVQAAAEVQYGNFFRRPTRRRRVAAAGARGASFDIGPHSLRWEIWSVVAEGLGRLHEVKYEWTLDELMDAHEYLMIKADAEAHAAEQARASAR